MAQMESEQYYIDRFTKISEKFHDAAAKGNWNQASMLDELAGILHRIIRRRREGAQSGEG